MRTWWPWQCTDRHDFASPAVLISGIYMILPHVQYFYS